MTTLEERLETKWAVVATLDFLQGYVYARCDLEEVDDLMRQFVGIRAYIVKETLIRSNDE